MNSDSSALPSDSNVRQITYRISTARELAGSLSVTVETSQLLRVRRAIVQSGCAHVGIVKAVPLACGTRVRMLIAVDQEDMARVRDAIQRELDARLNA